MDTKQDTRPLVRYETLYPSCTVEGCSEMVENRGEKCYPHLSDAVFKADRVRQAELRRIAR